MNSKKMNSREAAFNALLQSLRHIQFITHSLNDWQKESSPSVQDFSFANELAIGSCRMALALDYLGAKLSSSQKLNLKLKEKVILRISLYQYFFMSKVPLYAIVDESIKISKIYCHPRFTSYLNATLRKVEKETLSLSTSLSSTGFEVRYSYPLYFVNTLINDYGKEIAEIILQSGNIPSKTMMRIRPSVDVNQEKFKSLTLLKETQVPVFVMSDKGISLSTVASMKEVYIQNVTPITLVADLSEKITSPPSRILDLCASPGGKLIAIHDFFPQAKLFANDVSEEKLFRLSENLNKYGITAHVTCGLGENYSSEEGFDLIILDVPCSNSGVLNKRAEARWRLTQEEIIALNKKQYSLLEKALPLLKDGGVIGYMTCSILKAENESLIENFVQSNPVKVLYSRTILPNKEGWDGGFMALLVK